MLFTFLPNNLCTEHVPDSVGRWDHQKILKVKSVKFVGLQTINLLEVIFRFVKHLNFLQPARLLIFKCEYITYL